MKRRLLALVILTSLIYLCAWPGVQGAADPHEKYLTTADVMKVTGLKGVTVKQENLSRVFYTAEKVKLLDVRFDPGNYFDMVYKKMTTTYTNLPGLGVPALYNSLAPIKNSLVFLKSDHTVELNTFCKPGAVTLMVSLEQMKAIAKVIISRL